MSARIVVAHAGRQHSHQLARALHERGALHEYWTGLPVDRHTGSGRVLERLVPGAAYAEAQLPPERVRVLPVGSGAHFLERRLRGSLPEALLGQLGDYAADAIYARWLRRQAPAITAVVGYENGALRLFRAARRHGIRTILDAAAVHHVAADLWKDVTQLGRWAHHVHSRKDAELRYADHLLVLSELARQTYVAAGVPPARISVVPLGYDASVFTAAADAGVAAPLRFVFVGHASHTKGLDLLLQAARRLGVDGGRFRLIVIGDVGIEVPPGIELRGKLTQRGISAEFAGADCLVLPSRCDAFGLVVVEALGSGLPAIVSEHVGAKDLVTASGAGWVVPSADAAALAERMHWCIENPQAVLEAKARARAAAGAWTWERYRERVAATVLGLLEKEAPARG